MNKGNGEGQNEQSRYERALATLAPEQREALIEIGARVGIAEDDPLYALLIAQSELFQACMPAERSMRQAALEVSHLTLAVKELSKRCDAIAKTMDLIADVSRRNVLIALWSAAGGGALATLLVYLAFNWVTGNLHTLLISLKI